MRRRNRRSRRSALPRWPRRRYQTFWTLHAWEEDFVVAAICAHGRPVAMIELAQAVPGRFDERLLAHVFKRLTRQQRIVPAGMKFKRMGTRRLRHYQRYVPVYRPDRRDSLDYIRRVLADLEAR